MSRVVVCAVVSGIMFGCAPAGSGAGTGSPSGPTRILPTVGATEIQIAEDGPIVRVVASSPEQVWNALPTVYQSVGITGATADPAARVYGNRRLLARGRLGGQQLSRYLNCGRTSAGYPAADVYRIQLSVTTLVRPAASGRSEVQTEVTASGKSTEGTSTDPVRCASTGALEARIARLLGSDGPSQ